MFSYHLPVFADIPIPKESHLLWASSTLCNKELIPNLLK